MRKIIIILLALLFGGCATSGEKCLGYGFKAGTQGLANCTMREDQARKARVSNSLNAFADRQQRSFDNFQKSYGSAFKKSPAGNILNCNTSPDFGTGTRTTCN